MPSGPSGALIPTLEYLLAQVGHLCQRWNVFWLKRSAHSNVGMPSGPSGALIPTLDSLLAQAGRLFPRWNIFWHKQGVHSNVGIPSAPSWHKQEIYSNVGIPSGPSGALIPTLEYLLAIAGPLFQRWNTFWLKRGACSNVGVPFWRKRGAYSNVGIPSGLTGAFNPTLEYLLAQMGRLFLLEYLRA